MSRRASVANLDPEVDVILNSQKQYNGRAGAGIGASGPACLGVGSYQSRSALEMKLATKSVIVALVDDCRNCEVNGLHHSPSERAANKWRKGYIIFILRCHSWNL